MNQVKLKRSYVNQIYPFRAFLALSFFIDPLFFWLNGIKVFWFFIKFRFITHPMRFARMKKTFLLILEGLHRPSLEQVAEDLFTDHGHEDLAFDTLIMGHDHRAAMRVFPNGKQYINTGTWTPITSLDMGSLGRHVLRTYALIEYIDGTPRTSLKIWNGQSALTDDFA